MSTGATNMGLLALLVLTALSHVGLLCWAFIEVLKLRRLSQSFMTDSDRLRQQLLAMQADFSTALCNPTNSTNPKP